MLGRQRKVLSVVSLWSSEAADVGECGVLWLQGFGRFGLRPGFLLRTWKPVALDTLPVFWDRVGAEGFGVLPMVMAGMQLQFLLRCTPPAKHLRH